MEKTIRIGNEELKISSSLRTIIDYKSVFGKDLFKDIERLNSSGNDISGMSDVINVLFQLIYILHRPFTKKSYEEFMEGFDFSIINDEKAMKEKTDVFSNLFQSDKKKEQNP